MPAYTHHRAALPEPTQTRPAMGGRRHLDTRATATEFFSTSIPNIVTYFLVETAINKLSTKYCQLLRDYATLPDVCAVNAPPPRTVGATLVTMTSSTCLLLTHTISLHQGNNSTMVWQAMSGVMGVGVVYWVCVVVKLSSSCSGQAPNHNEKNVEVSSKDGWVPKISITL